MGLGDFGKLYLGFGKDAARLAKRIFIQPDD